MKTMCPSPPTLSALLAAALALACVDELPTGVSVTTPSNDASAAMTAPPPLPAPDGAVPGAPVVRDGGVRFPETSALFHVLDDLESGMAFGASTQTKVLYHWESTWDGANPRVPAGVWQLEPPRGTSKVGLHARGMNLPNGFDLFVDFHPVSATITNLVDWSRYAGIAFWARSASGPQIITVGVVDEASYIGAAPGEQMYQARQAGRAWHTRRVLAAQQWERHVILFEDLRQESAAPRPLRTEAINAIHFVVGEGGTAFETYLDDVTLLCRGVCPSE